MLHLNGEHAVKSVRQKHEKKTLTPTDGFSFCHMMTAHFGAVCVCLCVCLYISVHCSDVMPCGCGCMLGVR